MSPRQRTHAGRQAGRDVVSGMWLSRMRLVVVVVGSLQFRVSFVFERERAAAAQAAQKEQQKQHRQKQEHRRNGGGGERRGQGYRKVPVPYRPRLS